MTNPTDKELLEMAAKAAGIENNGYVELQGDEDFAGDCGLERKNEWIPWNPLTKSCHAFELAIKLKLIIDHTEHAVWAVLSPRGTTCELYEDHEDEFAAARKAIVRAAAEIGSKMK